MRKYIQTEHHITVIYNRDRFGRVINHRIPVVDFERLVRSVEALPEPFTAEQAQQTTGICLALVFASFRWLRGAGAVVKSSRGKYSRDVQFGRMIACQWFGEEDGDFTLDDVFPSSKE